MLGFGLVIPLKNRKHLKNFNNFTAVVTIRQRRFNLRITQSTQPPHRVWMYFSAVLLPQPTPPTPPPARDGDEGSAGQPATYHHPHSSIWDREWAHQQKRGYLPEVRYHHHRHSLLGSSRLPHARGAGWSSRRAVGWRALTFPAGLPTPSRTYPNHRAASTLPPSRVLSAG